MDSREIKIAWRATFRGFKIQTFAFPGAVEVELRRVAGAWKAFRPGTKVEFQIAPQSLASVLKRQVSGILFEAQLSEWQAYELLPNMNGAVALLDAKDFYIDEHEKAWRKTE